MNPTGPARPHHAAGAPRRRFGDCCAVSELRPDPSAVPRLSAVVFPRTPDPGPRALLKAWWVASCLLVLAATPAGGWERQGDSARKNLKGKELFRSGLKLEAARVWEEAFLDSCGGEELGIANNLGIVHYQLAQPQAAYYFFQYALTLDSLGAFGLKNRSKVEAATAELQKTLSRNRARIEVRTRPVPNARICFASEALGGCYKTPFVWYLDEGLHLFRLSCEGGDEVTVEVNVEGDQGKVLTVDLPGPSAAWMPAGGGAAGATGGAAANGAAGGPPAHADPAADSRAPSFVRTFAGKGHSCGLDAGGRLACWGDNLFSQLGGGTCEWTRNDPVPVRSLPPTVSDAAVGGRTSCAVTGDGLAWCWGSNASGQVGDGSGGGDEDVVPLPTPVVGIPPEAVGIAVGESHACVLLKDGSLRCFGDNRKGQLGIGLAPSTLAMTAVPMPVPGLTAAAIHVSAGTAHTCALLQTGIVVCWGANEAGQLGNGATTSSLLPIPATGLGANLADVTCTADRTCATTTDGKKKCVGGP
ncbi:MAG: hypothetical protein FJ109_05390 [Deltaproteobacteria bacterium]|nr:hypothetical protein [Deltaproteobacteria bacterium]